MTLDVREVLAGAAHTPAEPTDYEALERAVRARRWRRGGVRAAAASIVAGLAIVAVLNATDTDRAAEDASPPVTLVPSPGPSPTPTGTQPWLPNGVPVPVVEDGAIHHVSVTLPDGRSFELSAPAAAGLDQLTAYPDGAGAVPGQSGRDFVFLPGGLSAFESMGNLERELRRTDDATVTLWTVDEADGGPLRYLVFEFGDWVLGVWDGAGGATMTDDELQTWADNLHGTTTADGFLVLRATGPLDLSETAAGVPGTLVLGEPVGHGLTIVNSPCDTPVFSSSPGFATMCQPEWGATIQVQDDAGTLVELLETGLSFRPRP